MHQTVDETTCSTPSDIFLRDNSFILSQKTVMHVVGAVSCPGRKRKEHCGCAVSGKTCQVPETFTMVSPMKRAARARARPPML